MLGAERLDQHPAASVASAGAAGNLRHQLKGPFGGPEIREVQRRIRVDHADQRHVGKIESFGDHLRAEQDADVARPEGRQCLLVTSRPLHRVRIHPQRGDTRETVPEFLFQPLRPHTGEADSRQNGIRDRSPA
jgi:hypothetical protein